jgi:hypothetical protein
VPYLGPHTTLAIFCGGIFAVIMFALLAYSLYHFARKKLD